MAMWTHYADHMTCLYLQKLALTSPTSSCRSVGVVCLHTKSNRVCFSFVVNWKSTDVSDEHVDAASREKQYSKVEFNIKQDASRNLPIFEDHMTFIFREQLHWINKFKKLVLLIVSLGFFLSSPTTNNFEDSSTFRYNTSFLDHKKISSKYHH